MNSLEPQDLRLRIAVSLLLTLAIDSVWAARPMATDDTNTSPAQVCQLEVWGERVNDERSQVIAPACGITDTLELDTGISRIQGGGASVNGLVVGLKWVPSNNVYDTALGTARFGLEGGVFWARQAGGSWHAESIALVGLGSLQFAPSWNLYANLITSRIQATGKHVNGLRTALAWQPDERVLLFAEGLRYSDGGNLRNAGMRLWAIPEVLGLDIVSSRSAGGGLSFSVGIGWYGIALP
jgi:hypothetical protein